MITAERTSDSQPEANTLPILNQTGDQQLSRDASKRRTLHLDRMQQAAFLTSS